MKNAVGRIEVGVPTKDRYEQLAMLLWSLLEQDYKEWDVTIIDDSEKIEDIREIPFILSMLKRMDFEGHEWRVKFGKKKGPHYSHQMVLDETRHFWIFRVDDDCILDKFALGELVKTCESEENVGAVGSIVVDPTISPEMRYLPLMWRSYKKFQGKIDDWGVNYGDNQWRRHPDKELQEVEHIYSSFLYRADIGREIGGYNLDYNVVGHREETDFSYSIFKKGYKLFVNPSSIIWHLRNPKGGIRTYDNANLWAECNEKFVRKFGFERGKNKDRVIRIFGGLGDHLCATPLLRQLKKNDKKVVISAIYHPLLAGNPNVDELILPDEDSQYEKIEFKDLYKWGFETGFDGKLSEAFCKMLDVDYDGDVLDYSIHPLEKKWVFDNFVDPSKWVVISTTGGVPVIQFGDIERVSSGGQRTGVKDWINDRWESLVKRIKSSGYKVLQVGGANDVPIQACDMKMLGVNYRLTMAILSECKTWVSVDTFLGHAGHAVKKPGVVLFGPTDPKIFGHDMNVNICHPKSCISKSCVQGNEPKFQWLSQSQDCSEVKKRNCMKSITVDEVFKKLKL